MCFPLRHLFCFWACFLGIVSAQLRGQDAGGEFSTRAWTTQDGLPHNRINQITQDAAGFLWIATHAGLVRFDGHEFKDFPLPENAKTTAPMIRNLAGQNGSALAVLPASDEVLLLESGTFRTHPISAATAGQIPSEVFTEPDGTLWVGTLGGKLYRWHAGDLQSFGAEDGIDAMKPSFTFALDGTGRLWVATGSFLGYYADRRLVRFAEPLKRIVTIAPARSGGLWVLSGGELKKMEQGKLTTIAADPPWLRLSASVRHLYEDREGRLWLAATNNGLFWLRDGQITRASLPYNTIQAIVEDQEGNLWLGTKAEGLAIVRRKRFRFFDTATGLPQALSTAVCEDAAGNIWFANSSGGLVRWAGGQMQRFLLGDSNTYVHTICPDQRGNLWVATADGLYRVSQADPRIFEKIVQPISRIISVFVASGGDVWIVGGEGEMGFLHDTTFHAIAYSTRRTAVVTAIAEDGADTLWIGTNTGNLFVFKDGVLQPIPYIEGSKATQINCLYMDRFGALWIGTPSGLYLYNLRENGRVHHFAETEGLRDHIILQLIEDDLDHLWIGSSRGYFYISRAELMAVAQGRQQRVSSLVFGKDEGLAGALPVTATIPSTWKDRTGQLWLATQQGVVAVQPKDLTRPATPAAALIDEIRVDDQKTNAAAEITVPPGLHRVEFRFTAPSYTSPGNASFRHQLAGVDADWIETEPGHPVSYPNLLPGTYRLRVIACDGNGVWNKQAAMQTIRIAPAWWQRTSLRVLAITLFLGALALLLRSLFQANLRRQLARVEAERTLDRERTRIARDVHDELGSGITSIRFLISRLKNGSAENGQTRIVEQLTRQTQQLAFDLERVVWTVNPKSHSLDQLAAFVGRFAQNLIGGSSIRCIVRRESNIPPRTMTPESQHHILAVAKEAINNALKHSRASEVHIETGYAAGIFALTIRDNGFGFDPAAEAHSERNGLSNMKSRTEEIGGQLEIASTPTTGTAIRLHVPTSL